MSHALSAGGSNGRLRRLLAITFLESFATILVERGVYFYAREHLGFTDVHNLWFALGYGLAYVAGALLSHRASLRLGEKRLLVGLIGLHLACHVAIAVLAVHVLPFVAINLALAAFTGAKWPLIESYVCAGRAPASQARAIGLFNIGWASAAPAAIAAGGPLIAWSSPALFATAAAINVLTLVLLRPLERRPTHAAPDHPQRLAPHLAARYRALMFSGRWSTLASFTLLFLLLPLLPGIFERMGFSVLIAPALASAFEIIRTLVFVVLQRTARWHGRADLMVAAAVGLPVGFLMVLLSERIPAGVGVQLAVLLAGEVIFGFSAGLAYYAALYYAMALSNASVASGGAHESLVGGGFAIGPAAGLVGRGLAVATGSAVGGMLLAVSPLCAILLGTALWPLCRLRHHPRGSSLPTGQSGGSGSTP